MVAATSEIPAMPPADGSITVLPGFVDFQAKHNPDKTCAIFSSSTSPTGTDSVSFKEFAKGSHRIAHALRPNRKGKDGEVVAIVIHTDALLYMALLAGMIRAGLVPFPMSPRNSAPAIVNMLEKTSCHRIVSQPSLAALIGEVEGETKKKGYALQVDELPSLRYVFPALKVKTNGTDTNKIKDLKLYPKSKKPVNMDATVAYLHSSGSTGFPKPIPQSQNSLLSWCHGHVMYGARERRVQWAAMALPTFHSLAFSMQFLIPFLTTTPVALYEPKSPSPPVVPTPQNVLEVSKLTGSSGIPAVPSMVETWAQSDDAVKYLSTLKVLMYAGGPLSKKAGDKLVAAGVKLTAVYGATEFGTTTLAYYPERPEDAGDDIRSPEDWEWMQMAPRCKLRWIPQGDGTYELHILTAETFKPSIENLPDIRGYATSDLWEPHPTKKGLWRITGRTDDVIILNSAEKVVPIPQEGHLCTNPMVKGVMMFGRGKEQAGVIIEPHPEYAIDPNDEKALVAFRNKIWPTVEEANHLAPAFAKIFKEMIIVTNPSKPLPRPAKQTIARKQALVMYADEIEKLYETVENSSGIKDIIPPKSWTFEDVQDWLSEHSAAVNDGRPPDPNIDLFEQGFDSLGATFLRNRIIGAFRASKGGFSQQAAASVSQNFVFDHPTIRDLAQAICTLIDPSSAPSGGQDVASQIKEIIHKYGADMPVVHVSGTTPKDGAVVLLTGSTGNIGSHILASLLSDDRVVRVYAMNRGDSSAAAAERQKAAFEDRGLPLELLSGGKFIPLTGDLGRERFGLAEHYDEIKDSVTHIVHNAWMVHFKHPLSSFESQIAGTRKIIDFCMTLGRPVRLIFTSSIAVAQGWDGSQGTVPEEPLPDPGAAAASGYAASKYVVEQLLGKASRNGLAATSMRVGQVSGSKDTGAWNISDWVPILVKSSLNIGCFPDMNGPASWVPMDAVADLTLDLMFASSNPSHVVNVVHPKPITWRDIFSAINIAAGSNLPFVPIDGWLGKLEALASDLGSQEHLERVPALKLLEFYRGMAAGSKRATPDTEAGGLPLFQTAKLQRYSPTMRNLPPIDGRHAAMWVKYWRDKRFLE